MDVCSPLLPDGIRALIVTHDVDWPRSGPGVDHILARRRLFDENVINKVLSEGFNPYYGVPAVMEVEERLGIRSTFFFRPKYDDGSPVQQYADTIKTLLNGGWEVGLHANSTSTVEEVAAEKEPLERVMGKPILGSRVHYLRVSANTFLNLAGAKIKYDSSLTFDKERIDPRNTGCLLKSGVVVFPVTFMDAYLFTYMRLTEKTIVNFVFETMEKLFASGVQIMTLLWHDNSIMMKGGRVYSDLMEKLVYDLNVTFLKGIDAFELVQRHRTR